MRKLGDTVTLFRIAAVAEAISWLGLLSGMFFKYVVVHNEIGVKIFGPIHGALFLAYCLVALLARGDQGWSRRTFALALLAAVPPLATVWFERWATGRGELNRAAPAES
ncbi:MAG: DUF3817 domain-containing protein [Micromonosporaceae bacterium]|nr:DUF3817 domain-containing protein [Micromonosporaceae bacterium]